MINIKQYLKNFCQNIRYNEHLYHFKMYANYSITASDNGKIPRNSFYKSLYTIDSVIGHVKDIICGVTGSRHQNFLGERKKSTIFLVRGVICILANIVLQPLYLALAYISYWPVKGFAKVTNNNNLRESSESLVDYSNVLSSKTGNHSAAFACFVNTVLSYACAAVIWAAALAITPLVWIIDKVASKLNGMMKPKNLEETQEQENILA
ncbi:MAG: hypothetical protein QWI36_01195 [Wolbachia endosymbiont of Tyrophagus putrescentiae]|nr:hypothetical protein [Wolbachia endosymbiont of Tyrophagus putrescentiae]